MLYIIIMNNINIDLNLLQSFILLMETKKVTHAAKNAGVTQSAMSHMLNRLREQLNDPLFIKVSHGIEPTEKAVALYQQVQHPLQQLLKAVNQDLSFIPEKSKRQFNFLLPDYVELTLLTPLLKLLDEKAPWLTLKCISDTTTNPFQGSNNVDFSFGHFSSPPESFYCQRLWQEEFVTIASSQHPRIKKRLSLQQFTNEKHILISPNGSGESIVDRALNKIGKSRKVVLLTPHFTSPPQMVEQSELICTLPVSIARVLTSRFAIGIYKPPIKLDRFDVSMLWGPVAHHDPAHQWLRQQIKKVCNEFLL